MSLMNSNSSHGLKLSIFCEMPMLDSSSFRSSKSLTRLSKKFSYLCIILQSFRCVSSRITLSRVSKNMIMVLSGVLNSWEIVDV